MGRYKIVRFMVSFTVVLIILAGLVGGGFVLAAQNVGIVPAAPVPAQDEPEETVSIELENKYPIVTGLSGDLFDYNITVKYRAETPNDRGTLDYTERGFDLTIDVPDGWLAIITGGYPERELPYVELDGTGSPEGLKVKFGPYTGTYPERGDYVCTLHIKSTDGVVVESMDLIARVTDRYDASMVSGLTDGNLNPKLNAGKEYHFPVMLKNSGTANIEDITFTSIKPDEWLITFDPEEITVLEPGITQEIDVIITAPSSTISGDYIATLKADSEQFTPDSMRLRVTVQTSTLWGGAGVAIVVAVIAGLVVMFMRLGRR